MTIFDRIRGAWSCLDFSEAWYELTHTPLPPTPFEAAVLSHADKMNKVAKTPVHVIGNMWQTPS